MNILGIDSTTSKLSVAISKNDKLLSSVEDKKSSKHMVNIISFIDEALYKAKLTLKDVDVFGVNLGPGDFTGTRIGVSIIKTLSWLENKVAYGINSLDVFAIMIVSENRKSILRMILANTPVIVVPCLDVRKSEIYFSFYEIAPEKNNIDSKPVDSKNKKIISRNDYIDFKLEGSHIAKTEIKGEKYCIKRVGDYYLVGKDNFIIKFSKFYKNDILKMPHTDRKFVNPLIIIGGNAYTSYRDMMSGLTDAGKSLILDKKALYPAAKYVNLCSYFNAAANLEAKNLTPIYVREFIPFGK